MKRLILIWSVCGALSLGALGLVVLVDRRLDLPVPYAVPLALGSMLVLGPALLLMSEAVGAQRPVQVEGSRSAGPASPLRRPARVAQGVVLLDLSATAASTDQVT